jgi:hypothetical protein
MTVTTQQRHKVNRDPVRDPHIILLEFQEDGNSIIERAAINTEDFTFEGNVFIAAGITVKLPSAENNEPTASLSASNVELVLGRALNAATRRINVRMILVDTSEPDTAILDTGNLLVATSSTISGVMVEMHLAARASMQEPVPNRRTSQNSFPGTWVQ